MGEIPDAQCAMELEVSLLDFKLVHLSNVGFAGVMAQETVMEEIRFVPFAKELAVYLESYQQ